MLVPAVLFCADLRADEGVVNQVIVNQVLEWSSSVVSYSGEFEYRERNPFYTDSDPEIMARGQTEKVWHATYKSDGPNRLIEGTGKRGDFVDFDGFIGKIGDKVTIYERDVGTAEINGDSKFWGSLWVSIMPMTPECLLGNYNWAISLRDCYSAGHVQTFDRGNGITVCSFRVPNKKVFAMDVYWDEGAQCAKRIDYVTRPKVDLLPKILAKWDGDPFDLRSVKSSLEILSYETIDGIVFPTSAHKTFYAADEEPSAALGFSPLVDGDDYVDWLLDYYQLPTHATVETDYLLYSCRLNVPIPESEFEISIPKGVLVVDRSTGEEYTTVGFWESRTHVRLAVIAGVFLPLSIFGYWVYVGKRRRRTSM